MKTLLFSILPVLYIPFMTLLDEAQFFGLLIGIIGYFIIRMINKQEEINKKIDVLILNNATNDLKLQHIDERLTELEIDFKNQFK